MKFLSLADWKGIIETELFSKTYRSYGLATVRYPVLEIEGRVEPFENGRGFTLRAMAARRPRSIRDTSFLAIGSPIRYQGDAAHHPDDHTCLPMLRIRLLFYVVFRYDVCERETTDGVRNDEPSKRNSS
jgi:hypothetical protein